MLPFLRVVIPIILLIISRLVTTLAVQSPRFAVENFVHKLDLRSIALITDVSVMNRNSTKAFAEFLTCFESKKMANRCSEREKGARKGRKQSLGAR